MLSDLQKQKLGRLFNVLDSDHNGRLEKSDYDTVVSNLAKIHGWQPGSPEHSELEGLYMTIWGNLKALADADNDGQVTPDEFMQFHAQMLSTPDMYDQITIGTVDLLFEAFDANRDGFLSREDFGNFFAAYNIKDQAVTDEAFKKLDVAGKGKFSKDETLARVKEFYFSNDPAAAGNWLFGRYS